MKKILTLSLVLLSIHSKGQITVSGSGDTWIDGIYLLSTSVSGGNFTCSNPFINDVGTSVYFKDNSANPGGYHFQFRRVDGYWYLEGVNVSNSAVTSQRFRTKFEEFSNTPPCGVTWLKYSDNYCYYGQSNFYVIAEVNSLILSGNCESCVVSTDENHPMVHNFPISDNVNLSSITPADGLRPGSTVYHCGLRELVYYDGYHWNKRNGELLFEPTFEALYTAPNIEFAIWHPAPSAVDSYEIQMSNNRSDWSSIGTYPNTTSAISIPATNYPEKTYHFKLITHYVNHDPQVSCIVKMYKPYTGPDETSLPNPPHCCAAAVDILEDYVPGTLMTFNVERFVPDASADWHLRIKDEVGNTIIDQTFTPTGNPHSIKLSTDLFEYNKLYVADAFNPFWAGSLNNEFYVKERYKTCP